MLTEIHLSDLGVIEEAHLDLGPGLTVVTGETGAGKTMVVTGLGLLLGQRAVTGLIREGATRAVVEGVATLPADHPALVRAGEAGADTGADTDAHDDLVLVRTVTAEGRSRAHVGGRSAPIGVLGEIGEVLVAVHGQADQWRLRHLDQHRELLDRFGGADVTDARAAYQEVYAAHAAAAAELTDLRTRALERAQEAAALTAALERLEAVDPQPGEDAALAIEADRLGHLEELRTAAATAADLLSGADEASGRDDPGIVGRIAHVRATLDHAGANDPALAQLARRATDVGHALTELAADVASYLADLEVEPGRLDQVQDRRAALGDLTRVYGPDVDGVLAWGQEAAARLTGLLGADDRVAELETTVEELAARRDRAAAALTDLRVAAAERLAAAISGELGQLAMASAVVGVEVRPRDRMGSTGADEVEIGLRANSGGALRPIARSASGGELSRLMLAIEVATAAQGDGPPTFVFDEVDAGIGGRAALAVGARLAALAEHAQVIVVTHLAQVAAHADRHLVVHKSDDGQVTRSGVRAVEGEERIEELARMLGGTDSSAALDHARDLRARVRRDA
jgi:DNA repair protein RecN (Recombination protein N)